MTGRLVLCLLALCVCMPAWAQIKKCVDAGGKTSYVEGPCPDAKPAVRVLPSFGVEQNVVQGERGGAAAQPGDSAPRQAEQPSRRADCERAWEQLVQQREMLEEWPVASREMLRGQLAAREQELRRECP
jgi:hypothetical protein